MLILLSPAKTLDMTERPDVTPTAPRFESETDALARALSRKSAGELASLMALSAKLAESNRARYRAFGAQSRKPAALAFAGDVYRGLDAGSLDPNGLKALQARVRILSGLYGLLRPLDAIEPYRLEMGTKLRTRGAGDLYAFWGDKLARGLEDDLRGHDDRTVVNLASQEYARAVLPHLTARVVTPVFREEKDGQSRTLALFAKVARGRMARWAAERGAGEAGALKAFDADGYTFRPDASDETTWVFARAQPPKKG